MTFSQIEASRQKGRPTNLFHVRYGDAPNSYYAYTDAEQPIENGGIKYEPLTITRGKIVVTGTLDKAAMEVRMTLNVPLAEHFRVYPPSQVVNLTILQGHLSDPSLEFLVAWTGRVISAKRTENELVLTGEPISTSMKRVGLRRHYQYSCPHVLYGSECKANKTAATTIVAVAAIANTTITLPVGWTPQAKAEKYVGGIVEWVNRHGDKETRTILKVTGFRNLVCAGFLRDLVPGQSVNVILGCNHGFYAKEDKSIDADKTDCYGLHDNIHNFGGCPFIPTENPVGRLNMYY